MKFERIVRFEPAFDRRHSEPSKNYGIHGVSIRFVLKGDAGAVQFLLYTGWQLPHVEKESEARYATQNPIPWFILRPTPADIGYHSPHPMYDGQEPMNKECEYIGGVCYYDGSGLAAERYFDVLVAGGDDALWIEMENYYDSIFGDATP